MNNQNKQGGIDWTDYTWNPISGCLHGCIYCYLKLIENRVKNDLMRPKFNRELLIEPVRLRKKSKIFVGSSGDMFGKWVQFIDIATVLYVCCSCFEHTFQFLTKNPSIAWADALISQARAAAAAVWIKNSYGYPLKIKEFPDESNKKR